MFINSSGNNDLSNLQLSVGNISIIKLTLSSDEPTFTIQMIKNADSMFIVSGRGNSEINCTMALIDEWNFVNFYSQGSNLDVSCDENGLVTITRGEQRVAVDVLVFWFHG